MLRCVLRRDLVQLVGRGAKPAFYSANRVLLNAESAGGVPAPPNDQSSEPSMASEAAQQLYKLSQKFTVRVMLGVTYVNGMYWGSQIVNFLVFKGSNFGEIDLGGDPSWGYAGMAATGCLLYFTRHFSHQTVYQAYLTPDGRRIGFQVHNMFGNPGRKFEVSVGNARFADAKFSKAKLLEQKNSKSFLLNSSMVPLQIEGIKGNVLVDTEGLEQHNGRLLNLLLDPAGSQVDNKENRADWRKQFFKEQRTKNKTRK